ncbi:hypothetical protein A3D80_03060 [Candidatus Roizmanbacteria bacterium RIFCSPHIGHO2_02_FULL_40_13b]|uniref:ATP synthase F1 subunit gamma n=1 Tax=Candidatus Roizmanbacteria bacterium RIFCSPHIGHO2_01_FULL_39_24 TaxID=1802032 RepID=A0A1F7GJV6_9BACT|nr:MAG: hypothetical protein A2799_02880 [Candidatus Roizmanbacteria bacterium RIFCSPHIGHO2_01_FULL_39_24]OGK27170.1 MAG: hypothetical protein A3D80_03060 [Candidatus Roizmanbacteria bacterium RIFCSPHIGHO2_02_FULL_40_13b]OGK49536.1 MAG: hypothetical protein A3A56_00020 [Candidatus Roizmanbacteria bacterium RIFCSPLOWO2_01_FULL_40_32]OGK57131.1 MAG: hypothetical protein A3H83_02185 [Candidatus Roizmanbacteria bacterium RIFCSPLOWO2_02_FULL_39_8]
MQKYRQIKDEIGLLASLKILCTSYEEISVMNMQRIRQTVLATRTFYIKLAKVYYHVKNSYKDELAEIMKKKRIKDPSQIGLTQKNGKAVCVFISANAKLHGVIIDNVFNKFEEYIKTNDTDIIIIGKLGRDLYERLIPTAKKKQYLYFEIPDMQVALDDLKTVIYHLIEYEKITVFYGQYNSMLDQAAQIVNITGDALVKEAAVTEENVAFLFEPSLEEVVDYFEKQIFSALFKQTVHESQLARFASRITAMEFALEKIDGKQNYLYNERRRTVRLVENKIQLERLSGISLWGKTS